MTLSEPDIVNRPSLATPKKTITMPVSAARPDGAQATVVVLGVERGGTSMVAGVVRALGIEMGPRAGLNHEDPLFLTEDHELLKKRIATRNTENATWGFKVPKATMHLEFFESVLRRPVYLVAYRNSLAVADSWMQRGAGQLTGVLQRVQTYQDALLKLYETSSAPILLINYERAVQDGASQAQFVDELIAFLGIGVDPPTPSWGKMVSEYLPYIQTHWYLSTFPALMIALTMYAFTLMGDGLQDALNPRAGR